VRESRDERESKAYRSDLAIAAKYDFLQCVFGFEDSLLELAEEFDSMEGLRL
jgi:hypothetical protein